MTRADFARLAGSAVVGVALAVAAGLHSLSMVATRSAPEQAVALFPANAAARAHVAFQAFSENVSDPADLQPAAASVRDQSLAAFRSDPTAAKALLLLALGMPDPAARHEAALAASRINRRDLALQGAVLEAHLAADDFESVVETLDQILRVHTSRSREFFPVLGEALRDERTLPVFARLLDGSSPWHKRFLSSYGLGDKDLLPRLAQLRAIRDLGDEEYDRQLVDRLARTGKYAEASALYRTLKGDAVREVASRGPRSIDWTAEYPPFEWRLIDRGDFRAQTSRDGERLEIFVRPRKGGILAQRIVAVPQTPFVLDTTLGGQGMGKESSVRIDLTCPEQRRPFLSEELKEGPNRIEVGNAAGCDAVLIAIHARAFSGQGTLRAELDRISIEPR